MSGEKLSDDGRIRQCVNRFRRFSRAISFCNEIKREVGCVDYVDCVDDIECIDCVARLCRFYRLSDVYSVTLICSYPFCLHPEMATAIVRWIGRLPNTDKSGHGCTNTKIPNRCHIDAEYRRVSRRDPFIFGSGVS